MSARWLAAALLALASGAGPGASAAIAQGGEPAHLARFGDTERIVAPLGGALVAALAPPGRAELLALVRPPDAPDGERRLVRLTLGREPRLETIASGVGGWTKRLAALDLGSGPELVAAGLGRLDSLGPLDRPGAAARPLVVHPGFDLRALAPGRLATGVETRVAAAEVGALRIWTPDGSGGLVLAAEHALPFEVERTETGLRLEGPRVRPLADVAGSAPTGRWAVGPLVESAQRLRLVVLGGGDGETTRDEAWLLQPAAERLEQHWLVELDGEPALVARAQDASTLDLFERQRWRAWRLGADRTRAGRAPVLAVEVDSKRWHDGAVAVDDVDEDGLDDLVVARPEGLSGSDLVVEVRHGLAGGRLDARARRQDLEGVDDWLLLDAAATGGEPALLVLAEGELRMLRLARRGRRVLEGEPRLAAPIAARESGDGGLEMLGASLAGGGLRAIAVTADEAGAESLLVLRPAADP